MEILKLYIPGRFEHAYAYLDQLIILTEDQRILTFGFRRLVQALGEIYSELKPALQQGFSAHHDSAGSNSLNDLVPQALQDPKAFVEIPSSLLADPGRQDLNVQATVLLDVELYFWNMYLGADTGFYTVSGNWASSDLDLNISKQLDATCYDITAYLGVVNASCGQDGLFSSFRNFQSVYDQSPEPLKPITSTSLYTSWLRQTLVNYTSSATFQLLPTKQEPRWDKAANRPGIAITDIESVPYNVDVLLTQLGTEYGFTRDSIQYAYSSLSTLFLHTWNGDFLTVDINLPNHDGVRARSVHKYNSSLGRVLSADSMGPNRLLVETEQSIMLFADGRWVPVVSGEAISVKTFPRSKRYRNLVAVTLEHGLVLALLYGQA
ncbi:MAG: hypothetical protein M3390_18915 [Chloroflexota bacterium]|nr:hypothetical protein [Chloroflexota bacterium]